MGDVWITGARGFIGRHLARVFADSGRQVVGIGHGAWPPSQFRPAGLAHWLNGDITAINLGSLASECGLPEVIVHLAGGSSVGAAIERPREEFARTVQTTEELFEWLRQHSPATRVVAVSSAAVYGAGHAGAICEDAQLTPYSPYGYQKLMMEMICQSYGATFGIKSIVARLFSAYGTGLRKQLLWDLCSLLASQPRTIELGGSGNELRDWTDVRDVTRILASLPSRASAEAPVVNVGSGIATSVRDIAGHVLRAWRSPQPVELRFSGRPRPGDPFSLQAECSRLASFGTACSIAVADGIADYVTWYRAQGQGSA